MKTIKKLKILLILPLLFMAMTSFAPSQQYTAEANFLDDVFDTQETGLTFADYQGQLAELNSEGYDQSLTTSSDLREFIIRIVNYALGFLGLLAVIIVIYGGILYVTSAGDEEKTTTGRKAILYAVIGLLIVAGAFAFVNTIIGGATGTRQNTGSSGVTSSITGGRIGGGYNSVSEEVKLLAVDIYFGFSNLAETTQTFKDIQNEASSATLEPINLPSKTAITSFLSSVKAQLNNIKSTVPDYSKAAVEITAVQREVEAQQNKIKTFTANENTELIAYWTTERGNWINNIYLERIIKQSKEDYLENLRYYYMRLKNVHDEFTRFDSTISEAEDAYIKMRTAYGFDGGINTEIQYRNTGSNLYSLVSDWKLGTIDETPITDANLYLELGLSAQADFYKALTNLVFVEARLTANVIEGNAPLTVVFDALATSDPAGGSLYKNNIIWDLGGELTLSELMSQAFNGNTPTIIQSANVDCDIDSIVSAADLAAKEEKVGATSQRCIYQKPGTYQAAIKIKSNDDKRYAPGVSILTIKVTPPTTKIDLVMTPSGEEPIVLMRYNDEDILEINKKVIPLTLNLASAGIKFDATETYAEQYRWDFGNGEIKEYTSSPEATAYYESSGKYEVTLEVLSKVGVVDRKIFVIEVSDLSARITKPIKEPTINTPLTFDASSSRSDKGGIKSYEWTVRASDGQAVPEGFEEFKASGRDLSSLKHEFKYPIAYDILLTVIDQNNNKSSDEIKDYQVTSQKPIAQYTYNISQANQPSTVYFKGDISYDPDGNDDFLVYTWEIDADQTKWQFIQETNKNSKNPVIRFNEKGSYKVSLKVEDILTLSSNEEYDKITKDISIENTLDVAWGKDEGVTAVLNELGKANVQFTIISQDAVAYEMDFGDGNSETGSLDGSKIIKHDYIRQGRFEAILTVFNSKDEDNTIKRKIFIGDGSNTVAKINVFVNDVQIFDLSDPIKVSKKDTIKFDGSESKNVDGTGRLLLYSWDFGDMGISSNKEATHRYKELSPTDPGYYTVKLKVVDKEDTSLTSEDEIKINVVNLPPKFSSIQGIPRSDRGDLTTPLTVYMQVFGAQDDDGKITQYRWWYYDTDTPDDQLGVQITTTNSAKLTIGTNGEEGEAFTYGLGLEVKDSDNLTFSSNQLYSANNVPTISVVNGPNDMPVAKFNVTATKVYTGEKIKFTSNSTDADGQIVSYIWDFEGDGFYNNAPTDKSTVEHSYTVRNLNGYNVKLKVVDDKGGENISSATKIYIDAISLPPEADFSTKDIPGGDGRVVQFINESKADTDTGAELISYAWDFDLEKDLNGDGLPNNDIDSKEESPSHLYSAHGLHRVRLSIVDNQGGKAEIIKEVAVGGINTVSLQPKQNEGTTTENSETATENQIDENLKASLVTEPLASSSGVVRLAGELASVKFDFTNSTGLIKYFVIDKNTNFDTDGNGVKDDDWDFVTNSAGTWTTNYSKSWGDIAAKLSVISSTGKEDSKTVQIKFLPAN